MIVDRTLFENVTRRSVISGSACGDTFYLYLLNSSQAERRSNSRLNPMKDVHNGGNVQHCSTV